MGRGEWKRQLAATVLWVLLAIHFCLALLAWCTQSSWKVTFFMSTDEAKEHSPFFGKTAQVGAGWAKAWAGPGDDVQHVCVL